MIKMFNVRKIKPSDYKKIEPIKKNLTINDDYLTDDGVVAMVMIEDDDYKGFISYRDVDELSFVIDYCYTTDLFTDNQTKDLLLRSLLNYGLMQGKIYAYGLADNKDNFYSPYGFDTIDQQMLEQLKKIINNDANFGYKINITEFFNRPCDA